jgi:hypothetical protein
MSTIEMAPKLGLLCAQGMALAEDLPPPPPQEQIRNNIV